MKTGRTLIELAQEITRQRDTKRDLVVSTEHIEMAGDGKTLDIAKGHQSHTQVGISDLAHQQIATHTDIPAKYYNRMRAEAPALLATNVDAWFKKHPAPRMIRTLDGNARAFLSDRYRPLENSDLAEAVLPTLFDMKLEIMSCEITATRLYIKAVDPRIKQDVPTGRSMGDGTHTFFDTCSPALIISNSEVGLGALSIESGIWTKVCTNLAIAKQRSMRKYHVGGKNEIGDEIYRMLSDNTRAVTDKAVFLQVRDVVRAAFDEARFASLIGEVRGMAEQPIVGDPVKTVEGAARRFGLSQDAGNSILRHLIEGANLSRYGLFNAITRSAQDQADYDEATTMERLGGLVLDLPQTEWRALAEAA